MDFFKNRLLQKSSSGSSDFEGSGDLQVNKDQDLS
jgi:hypothetical protein